MDLPTLLLLPLITLIGRCWGQNMLPAGPLDAILGSDVEVKTLLTKPEYTFIIWNYNDGTEQIHVVTLGPAGLKINDPYEGRVTVNATNGYLSLKGLKSSDSGDYSITMLSTDGDTKTDEIKLRVLEPVSKVEVKSSVAEAVELNSTVVLTCTALGSFLTFSWTNGDKPLMADGKRITIAHEELSSAVTIAGILRSDLTGPVVCTAGNKLQQEKSAPFTLPVHYGPDAVTLSPAVAPPFVQSGSNFSLSCSAPASSPPATLAWFHDDKPMEASGPVLTLKVMQAHKLGQKPEAFTCRATNAKTMRVVASNAVSFGVMEAITGTKVTTLTPTTTLIAGTSSVNVSCQATAGTVATRAWLKNGLPLAASGGRLLFSADQSSLMIKPLQKEDSGEYKCQLTNPVSTDSASVQLLVNYGPEPASVTGEEAVEVNDPVTLTCAAPSLPPANFTWTFNGTATDVKTDKFVIEKARYKNTGTYACFASNAVTRQNSTASHKLSVKEEGALDEGLSDGAIAGIIIGILVALAAVIGLTMYCRQKVPNSYSPPQTVESPY